jgi:hypothetical protein
MVLVANLPEVIEGKKRDDHLINDKIYGGLGHHESM